MSVYSGITNISYSVGKEINRGGEGIIYDIPSMSNCVAKIFHPNCRTTTRERKIKAMIATNVSSSVKTQSTWPIDILYENGSFAGYIMLKLTDNTNINAIYSTSSNATLSERIVIAKNLCSAIQAIHDSGQVCGDLNPKNICVNTNSGRITLVDADSYHITDPATGHIFRCEVGLPEYFAPELQVSVSKSGRDLRTAPLPTFSVQTDLFALAVHIFALLMNGCHPFACAKNNVVNMPQLGTNKPSLPTLQPNENIIHDFFPFEDEKTGYSVPLYALDYKYLPNEIRALFHKAFKTTKRPTATEWYRALEKLNSMLIKCPNGHEFFKSTKKCPWCKVGQNMLAVVSSNQNNGYIGVTSNTNQGPLKKLVTAIRNYFYRQKLKFTTKATGFVANKVNRLYIGLIASGVIGGLLLGVLGFAEISADLIYELIKISISPSVYLVAFIIVGGGCGWLYSYLCSGKFRVSPIPWMYYLLLIPAAIASSVIGTLLIIGAIYLLVIIIICIIVILFLLAFLGG